MKINHILVDSDGVLTDGRLNIDHSGEKVFKSFHTRDVRAIRELVTRGFEVSIITADDWPGINHFAEKTGAVVEFMRDKSEVTKRFQGYYAIGDDAWDVPMLKGAVRAFAPKDADPSVLSLPRITVVECEGGRGVVACVLRLLMLENTIC